MNENSTPTPAPDYDQVLQKLGVDPKLIPLHGLKVDRHPHQDQFVKDLGDFLRMPFDPKYTSRDNLKVYIAEAVKRAGDPAFIAQLGEFLKWYDGVEDILDRGADDAHFEKKEVQSKVAKVIRNEAPPANEQQRANFLGRMIQDGYTLGGSVYYGVTKTILKARPKGTTRGILGWLSGAPKKPLDLSQEKPKCVRPREVIRHLHGSQKKKSMKRKLTDIRMEAQKVGVVFVVFDIEGEQDYPTESTYVVTDDGYCLVIDRGKGTIQCDPEPL